MNRIKELRIAKGITQERLGEILNVRKSTISRYEKGTMFPAPETLIAMANYFNVTIGYLLDHENSPSPAKSATSTASATATVTTDTMALTAEEREHLAMLRALSPEARRRVERNLRGEYEDSIDGQMQEATVC